VLTYTENQDPLLKAIEKTDPEIYPQLKKFRFKLDDVAALPSEIVGRVVGHNRCRCGGAVGKGDGDLLGIGDHVLIGHDVAVGIDHHNGADSLAGPAKAPLLRRDGDHARAVLPVDAGQRHGSLRGARLTGCRDQTC